MALILTWYAMRLVFEDVADANFSWLDGCVFVAHNVHFDYSFLSLAKILGITWNSKRNFAPFGWAERLFPACVHTVSVWVESLVWAFILRMNRQVAMPKTTAKFSIFIKRDTEGAIAESIRKTSGETILPPNLPRSEFDKLPVQALKR